MFIVLTLMFILAGFTFLTNLRMQCSIYYFSYPFFFAYFLFFVKYFLLFIYAIFVYILKILSSYVLQPFLE